MCRNILTSQTIQQVVLVTVFGTEIRCVICRRRMILRRCKLIVEYEGRLCNQNNPSKETHGYKIDTLMNWFIYNDSNFKLFCICCNFDQRTSSHLPDVIFNTDNLCPRNTAANNMVKNGFVKIRVIASATGINRTHANVVSIVKPPRIAITHSIILFRHVVGRKLLPNKNEW